MATTSRRTRPEGQADANETLLALLPITDEWPPMERSELATATAARLRRVLALRRTSLNKMLHAALRQVPVCGGSPSVQVIIRCPTWIRP